MTRTLFIISISLMLNTLFAQQEVSRVSSTNYRGQQEQFETTDYKIVNGKIIFLDSFKKRQKIRRVHRKEIKVQKTELTLIEEVKEDDEDFL